MPTIFSHAICGLALGSVLVSGAQGKGILSALPARFWQPSRFWMLTLLCPVLPDADVFSFALGVPYRSLFGHRGFSHSILFALIVAWLVVMIFFRPASRQERGLSFSEIMLTGYFFLATISHPCLDALTNGGLGVAFFSPWSNARYFFPFRPILVSPIGADFFSEYGMKVLESEILWIWAPSLAVIAGAAIWRKVANRFQGAEEILR